MSSDLAVAEYFETHGVRMKSAVILVAQGFQDEEYVYPYYRMLEEGWKVDVATPAGLDVIGKYGVPARTTTVIKSLEVDKYDMVFVPGGFECPDRLRMIPEVQKFVMEMDKAGKTIAAICHGPWVLISAGICDGRRMTGYDSIQVDLKNAGATVPLDKVVLDGNIITADHYRNNGPFMRAVIQHVNTV